MLRQKLPSRENAERWKSFKRALIKVTASILITGPASLNDTSIGQLFARAITVLIT